MPAPRRSLGATLAHYRVAPSDAAAGKFACARTLALPARVVADSARHAPPAQNVRADSSQLERMDGTRAEESLRRISGFAARSAWHSRSPRDTAPALRRRGVQVTRRLQTA